MIGIVVRRAASAIGVILLLAALMVVLQQLSRTDGVRTYLGANASPAAVAHERHVLGYDRPLVVQFGRYVSQLLRGDLGTSLRTRRSVSADLGGYLPATAELTTAALAFALLLGTLLGVASAGRWRGANAFRAAMLVAASTPVFLLGVLGIVLLYSRLHLLPASGRTSVLDAPTGPTGLLVLDGLLAGRPAVSWDALTHLAMPACAVGIGPAVAIGRVLRTSLIESLRADYVRTARAKGLRESRVLLRHALRNSLTAPLAMTGVQVGLMLAGVLVVENIFAWPGIGLYMEQSITAGDFPAIAGVTMLLGAGYVAINMIVDVLQAWADPRITTA
jgi:peptide/nickel transport system permease protein